MEIQYCIWRPLPPSPLLLTSFNIPFPLEAPNIKDSCPRRVLVLDTHSHITPARSNNTSDGKDRLQNGDNWPLLYAALTGTPTGIFNFSLISTPCLSTTEPA